MDFKNKIILPSLIFAMAISGCNSSLPTFSPGDTLEEFAAAYSPNDTSFHYMGYYFLTTKGQNVTLFALPGTNIIQEFEIFKLAKPSMTDFEKVETGMTIFEIVPLIGIPYDSQTSGMLSMVFKCFGSSKDYLSIQFNSDVNSRLIVSFVNF